MIVARSPLIGLAGISATSSFSNAHVRVRLNAFGTRGGRRCLNADASNGNFGPELLLVKWR
jgi:hypothetical protein